MQANVQVTTKFLTASTYKTMIHDTSKNMEHVLGRQLTIFFIFWLYISEKNYLSDQKSKT